MRGFAVQMIKHIIAAITINQYKYFFHFYSLKCCIFISPTNLAQKTYNIISTIIYIKLIWFVTR